MARPTTNEFAEILYHALAPIAVGDEDRDWDLLVVCVAIGVMFADLHDLVRDTDQGPGWSPLLDPARAPGFALEWLAHNVAGVELTPGISEAEQRAEITSPPAYQRGTPAAMKAAAQITLTGGKRFTLYERVYSAFRDVAITYVAETPDPAATARAILGQKVAGRLVTIRVDRGWSVGQFEAAYAGRTVADFEADFATVNDFETRLP